MEQWEIELQEPNQEVKKKLCSKCKVEPVTSSYYCKSCANTYARERSKKKNVIIYELYRKAKTRASERNIEFSLERGDIVLPECCPIFPWIKLGKGSGKFQEAHSYTLDRIDPSLGYRKDNICVISWRANELKRNGELYELEMLVKYLKRQEFLKQINLSSSGNSPEKILSTPTLEENLIGLDDKEF